MASGVSVESAAINGGIVCCKTSLQKSYQQAGSGGWKDQKYAALGGIVEECCSALTKPIEELQECMKKLEKLLQAVGEYEQVNL